MPIADAKPQRFGRCKNHKTRNNEYYDKLRNQAYCTICAIEIA